MKYFVKQVRAVRIDDFQFKKNALFEMSSKKAKELYLLHVIENSNKQEDVAKLFERGQFVNVHKLGLVFHGEDISDQELFKSRLEGKLEKEVWK